MTRLLLATFTAPLWAFAVSPSDSDPGVVSGRVYDAETGVGLEGVVVRAPVGGESKTDADGYYWLPDVATGVHVEIQCGPVEGYAYNYKTSCNAVALQDGEALEGVDFALARGRVVSGYVVDPSGQPVAGAKVHVRSPSICPPTSTARDGSFAIRGLPPWSTFSFDVEAPGLLADGMEYEMPEADLEHLVVKLVSESSIHGVVIDQSGNPLPGARIEYVRRMGRGTHSYPSIAAGEHGVFSLSGLLPANYEFFVEANGGRKQRLNRITLEPGESRHDVVLMYDPDSGLTISGRVTDSTGRPIKGVSMAIIGETMQTRASTNANGEYVAYDLDAGRYGLTYLELRGQAFDISREAEAGETGVDFVLSPRMPEEVAENPLRGRIVDARTGLPITSAWYQLRRGTYGRTVPDAEWAPHAGYFQTFDPAHMRETHDQDGRFEIKTYSAGDHSLYIAARGYAAHIGAVSAPQDDLIVALEPECRVEGRVVDPFGQPVPGAHILRGGVNWYSVIGPADDPLARSDREGRFSIGNLSEGVTILSAWHEDWGSAVESVETNPESPTQVTIAMPETGELVGKVSLDGAPISDISLNIYDAHSEAVAYAGIGKRRVRPDGSYHFPLLLPGDYRVVLGLDLPRRDAAPILRAERVFSISAGEQTVVDVEFSSAQAEQ